MNNFIVTETCSNIKYLSRQSLKGFWKPAVLATFLFSICLIVPTLGLELVFGDFTEQIEAAAANPYAAYTDMSAGSIVASLYSLLVTGAFTFGLTVYFLDLVREKKSDVGNVFCGFSYYFKTFGLAFMISVFTTLWSLLLIVPGIIAAIRYSQAFYILADDPEKGIMQCIRESKAMMKGNKAKFFSLQLSFIGWYLLIYAVIMVFAMISVTVAIAMPSDSIMVISMIVLAIGMIGACIGIIFLLPYIQAATTVFYEMANGNLRKAEEPVGIPPLSEAEPATVRQISQEEVKSVQELPEIPVTTDDENK